MSCVDTSTHTSAPPTQTRTHRTHAPHAIRFLTHTRQPYLTLAPNPLDGLNQCENGFGEYRGTGQTCDKENGFGWAQSDGWLTFTSTSPTEPAAALEELSLLLTSGRLTPKHLSVIQQAYARVLKKDGQKAALQRALKLIIFSAEFHSTAMNTLVPGTRPVGPPEASHDRKFKAVVVVFMAGGAG